MIVRNPFAQADTATLDLAVPPGWRAEPASQQLELESHGEGNAIFVVQAGDEPVRRARVAVDLTVGDVPFGQQAESLVDVE